MLLGVLLSLPAMARDFTYEYKGQTLTYTVIDEDAKTCRTKSGYFKNVEDWGSGNYVRGAIEIPSEASDGEANFTVVAIGDYAFYGYSSLGYDLTSVTIPASVTSIGEYAFQYCSRLTSVNIPESVTKIGKNAFCLCSSLTSVTIPNSVTKIGFSAFQSCKSLSSVIIRGSEVEIEKFAFAYCSSYLKCAYPNTMQNPFPADFHAMSYPKNAIISGNVIYGPDRKSVLFVAYNEDGDYSVPSYVTEIGDEAYRYLPNLTAININNDVTSIGDHAFADCNALENVILPMKLETLGSAVFENSGIIKNVVFNGPTPVEGTADVFDSKVYEDATLYVRSGRQTLFMAVSPWKFFYNITDKEFAGVEEIAADFNADEPCEIYNLNGVKVGSDLNGLTSGLYIVRQGNAVKKIAVK